MDTTSVVSPDIVEKTENPSSQKAHSAGERRRRKRAKISAQVHLRAVNAPQPFEEVCTTIDVSRDGLQIAAKRAGYWKGQQLSVTFPYSKSAVAINHAQPAEVVRVAQTAGGHFSIGIQFLAARADIRHATAGVHGAARAEAHPQSVVLAIEPDARSAENLRSMLKDDGYTVVAVATAQEALDVLKSSVPSVFIAEVETEDMSGQDLCLIIKRNERLRRVPVILLTRSAKPTDYSESHEMGAVVCMAKPFKPERLQHVVRLVAPPPALRSAYGEPKFPNNNIERTL